VRDSQGRTPAMRILASRHNLLLCQRVLPLMLKCPLQWRTIECNKGWNVMNYAQIYTKREFVVEMLYEKGFPIARMKAGHEAFKKALVSSGKF